MLHYLTLPFFLWLLLSAFATSLAAERQTHTYRTVEGLQIQADVYPASSGSPRPVLLWIHGGALILGNRGSVPPQLVRLCNEENFVLVSIDYRIAPETKLPGIIEDVRASIRWVRDEGPKRFNADPNNLVIAGASAGGYLALVIGTEKNPPKAIVSYWGYGDILGDWTTKKPAPPSKGTKILTEEEVFADIGEQPINGTTQEENSRRKKLFFYIKQNGNWTKVVSGIDPAEHPEKIAPYCPIQNLTALFPPLLLLHGTADRDVPVEQSVLMHDALKELGTDVEMITIEGGGHGLWGGDKKKVEAAFDRSLDFIKTHLTRTP